MPSHKVYRPFVSNLLKEELGDLSTSGTVVKVALLHGTTAYVFDADHADWSDVKSFECASTDYTAGGETLADKVVTTTGDIIKFDITTSPKVTSFTTEGTISARQAVLYIQKTTADDGKLLMSCFDFGGEKSSVDGEYKITWHADGIISFDVST